MAINVVNVTVTADPSPVDLAPAEGNVIAVPSGTEWPDTSSNPIVPMSVQANLAAGTATLQLVASDNYSAGVLLWDFIVNIRGLATVNVQQAAVNFSNGATQNLWTILQAAGWAPPSIP